MNKQLILKNLDAIRAALLAEDSSVSMPEHERRVLGIQLRNALRAVAPEKYATISVWVDEDGVSAVIADFPDRGPFRTTVQAIRTRIAQGRHQ
jgi:hypothetical protein